MTCAVHPRTAGSRLILAPLLLLLLLGLALPVAAVDLDKDDDGLTDTMEAELARKFMPDLWMSSLRDRNAFYGCDDDPEANVPYTVEPVWFQAQGISGLGCLFPGECLLFKVGLAYHRDFGDTLGINDHQGDSENYVALLSRLSFDRTIVKKNAAGQVCSADRARQDADCWWVVVDWTAAHAGESTDSSDYAVISPFLDTVGASSARTIYSAEGKHATYQTDASCDSGGFVFHSDNCSPRYSVRDTCFFTMQNVGNSPILGGDGMGDGYDTFIRYPESTGGFYDIWGGLKFGLSSAYRPKFDVDGADLWSRWYNCVFSSISQKPFICGAFDDECQPSGLCTCNDLCSPNRDYLACGNGVCSVGESCSSCAADCGTCPGGGGGGGGRGGGGAVCGNGLCEGGESCETNGGSGQCQADCGCCDGWTAVCFVAGTPVTLADGSQRAIEDVVVGDRVLAYDEDQGRVVMSVVTRVYSRPGARQELIRINDDVVATGSHPFYTQRGIVPAGELQPGDRLLRLGSAGTGASAVAPLRHTPVTAVERLTPAAVVYNIEVAGQHNFFAGGLLVHNKTSTGGCEPDGPMF